MTGGESNAAAYEADTLQEGALAEDQIQVTADLPDTAEGNGQYFPGSVEAYYFHFCILWVTLGKVWLK